MVVLGGVVVSYERGTPVTRVRQSWRDRARAPHPPHLNTAGQFDHFVQGYYAQKKLPTPLGLPQGSRHGPTVGSQAPAVSHERGTPVTQPRQSPPHLNTAGQIDEFVPRTQRVTLRIQGYLDQKKQPPP